MKGELFAFTDWDIGRLAGYPTVFSAGNVVTGKGNIVASRKHAREVSEHGDRGVPRRRRGRARGRGEARRRARRRRARGGGADRRRDRVQPPICAAALAAVRERVRKRQQAVGYGGDYAAWVGGSDA